MGISLSIPFDPCVNKFSHWIDEKVASTHNLEKNLAALETAMEDLKAKRDDLSTRLAREEDRGRQRLAEIQVWLTRVENIENEVNDLLVARTVQLQKLCLCGFCCKNPLSSCRYGKSVFLTLRDVEKLKSQVFDMIAAEKAQSSEVQERQLPQTIVGQETMLEKAWKHLKEDGVGLMGMYGMGGVGKTTLLKQFNNKFSEESSGIDFVIWVVVSKDLHIEKIQDEVARQVGHAKSDWIQKDKTQKADAIYNFLRKKRFVMLLDDIWEKVDLVEIGVPFPTTQNRCKVAFTTRSQDVCAYMGVEDPMEVQCLGENEAFDLFQMKVGRITLGSDPEIPELARIVAKKCCGLPLALNVIGETMSCKRTIQEWRHAIEVLNSNAVEFSGMEDKILPILKYSYDNIKEEHIKSCLLYYSLFPEDFRLCKKRLIDYWIGEGIIDGSGGIEKAENKGYEIIGSLIRASLLMEEVDELDRESVCMHDVIREMALWIAANLGKQKEAFIVHAGVGLHKMPKVENCNVVRRVSLMKKFEDLLRKPECLELTTLHLQDTNLETISSEFFKSMPKLVVLDLSDNERFYALPEEISELVSLQYLNLSNTAIRYLPHGLQVLNNLIHLDLEHTRYLQSIAGISKLRRLKVLKLHQSHFTWDLSIVEELESLEHLEILTSTFVRNHVVGLEIGEELESLELFLSSHKLTSCTQHLSIFNMESSGISLPVTMDKLRDLIIVGCSISEIKMVMICSKRKAIFPLQSPRNQCFSRLSKVALRECAYLRDLTLLMFAPNLKELRVHKSYQLKDIIKKEKACESEESRIVPFPKLVHLELMILPQLSNIHWSPLPFPCLKDIHVRKCPNLKKLPLDSKSGTHGENGLYIIYKEKEWIEGVEWEDEATKTRFISSCKQI